MKIDQIDSGADFDFGRTSKDYARYRDIYPESLYQKVYFSGIGKKDQKVLDLGTGTGVFPRGMYNYGAEYYGIDISKEQIDEAKRISNENGLKIHYQACSAEKTEFPINYFDSITAVQCFFTEGPLTGVHTGCLYYYKDFNEAGEPIDADGYDFKATLVQYGKIVLASNILYLEDTNDDGVFESETPQTCTVIMEASVVDGKTKLTGTGSFTGSDGETESYSGEAFVFGDGRSISCDSYWEADDTTKKSCGTFDCTKMGTSSIKGTVTISGTDGRSDLKFIEGEGTCVAAVLFGFDGDDMEDNAGAMTMGKVAVDGGIYTFAYEIKDIPAGEYYIFFGGLDQGDDVAEGDRLPDKTGEAVGVCGTTSIDDVAVLTDWIDGSPSDATKAAIAALKPIEVKEGETVLNLDFTAYVRSTDAPTP